MTTTAHVLITGVSRGIGLGLAEVFAQAGWTVHGVTRKRSGNAALDELSQRYGAQIQLIECDLDQPDAVATIRQALGQQTLRVALFNAGIYGPSHQDIKQTTSADVGQLFYTNAIAPIALAQHLAPQVENGGAIAFISSQMASLGLNLATPVPLYGASKSALNSLLLSWSSSLEQLPWSLLALHPGWVRTAMGGENAMLSVEQSAQGLYQVIQSYLGRNERAFVDYQGHAMPW
ncbi:SDR family oxidoreductase [Pseudomonas sp. 5P_3.1_Bac2]|uniref:SDR family oxidoreductase n=1 Tax=Pseudomonas sp. 5P_3.1_Bac2 TaxID=2971617 RepID=UPI0021C80D35|nr:SDR family oxidoreductase [Pseudomonas sp. 5P_3.1_Bac2]MCU1719374.1 SDR family oxidoreductase [Pseudomonas sp. 5P_3.1_Bac2]